jgi:hypothetical protein
MAAMAISWRPTPRMLRQFAALWIGFGLLLAWRIGMTSPLGLTIAALAVVVGVAGLVRPATIRLPFLALTLLTWPIGWAVSQVVLAVLFYGVFTPVGMAFRLAGRDALALRRPDRMSHWLPRPSTPAAEQYFRQF